MGWKYKVFKVVLWAMIFKLMWSIANHPAPQGSDTWMIKFFSWVTVQYWTIGQYYGHRYNIWTSVDLGRVITSGIDKKQHVVKEEWTTFDGVQVKMFFPNNPPKDVRGLVYYHGGGWTVGRADCFDESMAHFAESLGAVVASVEYPLRPENPLKNIHDDCAKAAKYFLANAKKWNVNPKRVAFFGESAGGNIVASTTLRLRDDNFQPMPKLHVVMNGPVQLVDQLFPSYQQNAGGPLMFYDLVYTLMSSFLFGMEYEKYKPIFMEQRHVPIEVRESLRADYISHDFIPPEQRFPPYKTPEYKEHDAETWDKFKDVIMNPYVSPLFAKNLTGMPEAYIVSAQYDMIRDEGFLWARKLRQWGIKVTHYNDPVGFHANMLGDDKFTDGTYAKKTLTEFLDKHL